MKKIVIGLSGGLDSAVLLALLLSKEYQVHCCRFYYGSKHNKLENAAAESVIEYYRDKKNEPVQDYFFDISSIMGHFTSDLLLSGGPIPEGHYEAENMKSTVVPGRNLIFASIMAGLAESSGASYIGLGVHAGDHFIYPDCRPAFITALNTVIEKSSDGQVQILTPLVNLTKAEVVNIGHTLQVPFILTRTCYTSRGIACGKCGSCNERLEAFKLNNLKDPIKYAKH